MKRRDSLTAILAGLTLGMRAARGADRFDDTMEAAASLIQKQVDTQALESAVLYVRQGSNTFQRHWGKAASADAMFLLGSITKPMTAAAVMVLADRGELRLSDPAHKFLPEFSEGARKQVTLEQLLIHTSGLPDQLPENNALRARHAPLADFVAATFTTPLLFKPGSRYNYQSMGILLAAEVVERITKSSLPEFLAQHLFAPLAMKHSALGLGPFKLADMVACQTEHAAPESGAGAAEAADWNWNSSYWRNLAAPWGGAHSSAADVAKFLDSFIDGRGKVLRDETALAMIQNHTPGLEKRRGLGFDLNYDGFGKGCSPRTFGHSGSTGTFAWADPASDTTCVILTSLPGRVSRPLLLQPVSDVVSQRT